jgi:molybdopterin-containing oxidoreductase family membrane subunit
VSEHYKILKHSSNGYWFSLAVLVVLAVAGFLAAHHMDSNGHWVTGMNNQVVWGLPHVFSILLILAASGALNVASMSSVFGKNHYRPWARFSGLLSMVLLAGGLMVLVLDLGRPDRLMVAMTEYNFRSIFAWNIFLYTGFMLVVLAYLWVQFERGLNQHVGKIGMLALIWRFVLTGGTGGIFGFLVARQLYDSAMLIPVFIVLSLVLGTAIFILVTMMVSRWSGSEIENHTCLKLAQLLGIFIALQLFLVAAFHLTNLYAAEHHGVERFILVEGGIYTVLFWLGQVGMGAILPMWLVFSPRTATNAGNNMVRTSARITIAAAASVLGAGCQLYVLIIGGQAYPQLLFPGKSVTSSFYDGVIADYTPSLPELMLGLGGVALAMLLLLGACRVLPFIPDPRR